MDILLTKSLFWNVYQIGYYRTTAKTLKEKQLGKTIITIMNLKY